MSGKEIESKIAIDMKAAGKMIRKIVMEHLNMLM